MADLHAQDNPQSCMLINVVWIGHCLYMDKGDYHEYMKDELLPQDSKSQACLDDILINK